jgi:threonine/homoserine/homoserine lactone efflux protein
MKIAAFIALAGAGYLLWRVIRAWLSAGPKEE